MKKVVSILLLALMMSCVIDREERKGTYTIDQKIYSVQGIDSVETSMYYWESNYYGKGVFKMKSPFNQKVSDSLRAVKFQSIHKPYN